MSSPQHLTPPAVVSAQVCAPPAVSVIPEKDGRVVEVDVELEVVDVEVVDVEVEDWMIVEVVDVLGIVLEVVVGSGAIVEVVEGGGKGGDGAEIGVVSFPLHPPKATLRMKRKM